MSKGGNIMRAKKIAACVLGATLLMQSSAMVFASEVERQVLTLDKAIQSAKSTSLQIKGNERSQELAKEKADMDKLMGGWYAYQPAHVDYQYKQKEGKAIEEEITLTVIKIFDAIMMNEEQLDNLKMSLELQAKQIQKSKIEHQKGLTSDLHLEEVNLKQEQTKQSIAKLEQNIDLQYAQLCEMIGVSNKKYDLLKPELVFEPYRDVANVNSFASSKSKDHIDLWKATEDLRVAEETPIYSQDYMTVVNGKAAREQAKDKQAMTEETLEKLIREKYVEVKQLESQYTMQQQELVLKEKQMQINKIYLEKGMISRLDYDMSVLEYEDALLKLEQTLNKHSYVKYELDHPHLIRASFY